MDHRTNDEIQVKSNEEAKTTNGGNLKNRALIVVLSVVVFWLAFSLVRVENERYALQVGMCRDQATGLTNTACLSSVQTRTSWLAHLAYGLGIL